MICARRTYERAGGAAALGGALEALLRTCPANDLLTLAEPEARLLDPECLPEVYELRVEILDLGLSGEVEPVRKTMPELLPLRRELFDLGMDLCGSHAV